MTFEQLNREFEKLTIDLCAEGLNEPLECAGIMMAQALRIYKTTMSQEEYDLITDAILKSRDRIQELKPPAMH